MEIYDKLNLLRENIQSLGSLAVAFSGGVDSTFLLKVAHDELGENVLAVTARSSTFPEREFREAVDFAKELGVKQEVIVTNEFEVEHFADNPIDRCYYCKHAIFSSIIDAARKHGIKYVADGSNTDDTGDYRPGMKAIDELKVVSPLKEAGLSKAEIRLLSKGMGLATWNKPSYACLASRIPYGQKITKEKLAMIDQAEQFLIGLRFQQMRVRHHGEIARIEVEPAERDRFFKENLMDIVDKELKKIGFAYVALDMKGYRSGSMNETIASS